MFRQTISLILLCCTLAAGAQSIYPGQFRNRFKVPNTRTEAECFDLADVRLLPSRFRDNMQRDSAWMVSIDTDRLLHSFYNNSGVWGGKEGGYMTVRKYGGWESLDCELRGHTTGHLMSAYALMYAATGSEIFKLKGDSIVSGLFKVQKALGSGYLSAFPEEFINRNIRGEAVWAPWYTLHKILSGLLDQYLYSRNDTALRIAAGMGDWAAEKLSDIDEDTRLRMLRNEFGGINESFYNLYAITGNNRYKKLAEFFYHNDVIDPLRNHNGDFGTKHTNTFIPKVLGEIRRYELTAEEESRDLSRFFWSEMTGHHIFAPGCLSDKEHFFPSDRLSQHISGYTGETCCTYNMLKLARHLFCSNPDTEIIDYYERALYNHILGQQDPQSGMVCYFLPLASGSHKVYSTPEDSFWCCVGSGFENHAKYAESIYFRSSDDKSLYVALFIPSTLDWKSKGITITQTSNFPVEPTTTLSVSTKNDTKAAVNIRYPSWAKSMSIKINGKRSKVSTRRGEFISLERTWKNGDVIDIEFGMELALEHPADNHSMAALLYGPVLLAGRVGTAGMTAPAPFSDPTKYNDYYTYDYNIPEKLTDVKLNLKSLNRIAPLRWKTDDGIIVEPLYDIHRERYTVYFNMQ